MTTKNMDGSNIKVLAVIAKFKEDVSWVKELSCPYKIYDKDKDIPNVGREAETYLRYIIEHYDNLPDHVVFLQGHPFDHLWEKNINYLNKCIQSINNSDVTRSLNYVVQESHNIYTRTRESFKALFDSPLSDTVNVCWGAQYIVPKSCILNRPKEFYEVIRKVMVDVNNTQYNNMTNCLVCPWTLERMWLYIFDKNIKAKNVKYEDLL
jgi:Protein of unknown function (DUF3431)